LFSGGPKANAPPIVSRTGEPPFALDDFRNYLISAA
jgi:hypothetical protein